jgi:TolB-like protein/DNA-binding winged helix-turn-helix (wHTH) protein
MKIGESGPDAAPEGYRLGDLTLDVGARRVLREGTDLGVAGLSYDLLLALVRAAPQLASFQWLMDTVWKDVVVGPETITQRVKLLRQALGDSAERPRYILAVRGHGYRLAVQPQVLLRPLQRAAAPPSPVARGAVARTSRSSRMLAPAAVALVAAGLLALWVLAPWRALPPPVRTPAPATANAGRGSIAVLPFANLTGDPSLDYVSDGMAEELINAVGHVPGLKVPARSSSFAYKGRAVDVREIGRDLGVDTILEGSVRSAGEQLRVSVQLVDARSGYQLWTLSDERRFADIFRLQDDLARVVVDAYRSRFDLALGDAQRAAPTHDVEAYRLFLQGESVVNGTPESFLAAIALYDAALARDPQFARALAGRAMNRAALVWSGSSMAQGLDAAAQDAERALTLDPGLSRAHVVLASVSALRGDWLAAEASFRKALALDPLDGEVRVRYAASLLVPTGKLHEARKEALEARRLAPRNALCATMLAFIEQAHGNDGEAVALADLAVSRGGDPHQLAPLRAAAAARAGRYADAAREAIEGLTPSLRDAGGAAAVQLAYAALGDVTKRDAALAGLSTLVHQPDWNRLDPRGRQFVQYLFAGLDAPRALQEELSRLLERGADAVPEIIAVGSLWNPELRQYRQGPQFAHQVERLGLNNYWRERGPPDAMQGPGYSPGPRASRSR